MLVKALEAIKVGGKSPFFKCMSIIFSLFFFGKIISLKIFNTPLYLLDLIEFWPTFGLFLYAKLPNYKRVRGRRLAEPSHNGIKQPNALKHFRELLMQLHWFIIFQYLTKVCNIMVSGQHFMHKEITDWNQMLSREWFETRQGGPVDRRPFPIQLNQ